MKVTEPNDRGRDESQGDSLEIKFIVDAILNKYGYDFRGYTEASLKRRIQQVVTKHDCDGTAEFLDRILTESDFFARVLSDLTITVSELFRDPDAFKVMRDQVFPYLQTYPEIKIWFAGCAGGEEVYSLAILLREAGLYNRCILYGTDINPSALKRAKDGIVDLNYLKKADERYLEAGGNKSLHHYYSAGYGSVLFDGRLKERMVFSDHNLVSDGVFGEMQLIFCRNTLIYFGRELQDRAIGLFRQSLCSEGFLCLGSKESLLLSKYRADFDEFAKTKQIYRKKCHE
jgi:chemotaxis protein methyltransferase CheR